ncbi:hypothetical protein RCL1_007469 [Eukaryota sp. TZLM3-RCL]
MSIQPSSSTDPCYNSYELSASESSPPYPPSNTLSFYSSFFGLFKSHLVDFDLKNAEHENRIQKLEEELQVLRSQLRDSSTVPSQSLTLPSSLYHNSTKNLRSQSLFGSSEPFEVRCTDENSSNSFIEIVAPLRGRIVLTQKTPTYQKCCSRVGFFPRVNNIKFDDFQVSVLILKSKTKFVYNVEVEDWVPRVKYGDQITIAFCERKVSFAIQCFNSIIEVKRPHNRVFGFALMYKNECFLVESL